MKKKTLLAMLMLALLTCLFVMSGSLRLTNLESVKTFVLSFGPLAPLIYILLFTLVPLTLFPDAVLAIASGTIFGVFWGSIYTMIGAACGATLSFFLARFFGRDLVMKLIRHRAEQFQDGIERQGFFVILIMRLIPLIPFDIISYGAGLSKIRYSDFLLGTLLGIVPGVLIYVNLGDKALDIGSPAFCLSMALLIGLFALSYYLKRKLSFKSIQHKLLKTDED